MSEATPQDRAARGWMAYPSGGWRRLFFKTPLYLWRMGLGWAMPRQFLLLTNIGRKSGAPRRTMLECFRYAGCFYVASGWGSRSQWFRNIQANPHVTVQTWQEGTTGAQAELVQGDEELTKLYHHFRKTSPFWGVYLKSLDIADNVDDFLAKQDRLLIVRFTPTTAVDAKVFPLPQRTDLLWVWGVLVAASAVMWRLTRR